MWVAEFRVWHAGSYTLEQTAELDVKIYIVYLNPHLKHGKLGLNRAMVVTGRDADKCLKMLRQEKRLKIKRIEGNQVFYEINPSASYHTAVISPELFLVRPILMQGGFEYWTLASWSKKRLVNFVSAVKNSKINAEIKLISIKQEPVQLFSSPQLANLTSRQREAFLLAMHNGYYNFPRKVNLHELAHLFGTNVSSFRENLRKAEQKILSSISG